MAVALPPPLPPQPGTLSVLREQAERSTLRTGRYRVHLLGAAAIPVPELDDALRGIQTADEIVAAISHAYYRAGALGTQLVYAQQRNELYVLVVRQPVIAVRAPEQLLPFFADVDDSGDDTLQPRTLLADLYSERTRLDAQASLQQAEQGQVLDIAAIELPLRRARFGIEFSNPGNRFVGRQFVDLDARYDNAYGDRFSALWRSSLKRWTESDGDRYDEWSLSASRVMPQGLFGLSVHQRNYRHEDRTLSKGELSDAEFVWQYPLAASLSSRWIVDLGAQYVNDEQTRDGELDFRERYPLAQAGLRYTRRVDHGGGGPWDFGAGLQLRQGFGGNGRHNAGDLDFFLWSPSLNLSHRFDPQWQLSLDALGQIATMPLPEQMQWVLGGADNLVAYLPGVAVGDSGLLGTLSLQYRTAVHDDDLRVQLRGFVEYGNARFDEQRTVGLADVGAAVLLRWRRHWRLSLAMAWPLADHHIDADVRADAEAKGLFSIKAMF